MSHHVVLSGPLERRGHARAAIRSTGCQIVMDADGEPLSSSHGHADGHETRWTGARYQQGDIDALDEASPGHGYAVGDVVKGTGHMEAVPPEYPVGWLTVETEVPTDLHAAAGPLGWRVRGQWNHEQPLQVGDGLTDEQRLARIESDLGILKGRG